MKLVENEGIYLTRKEGKILKPWLLILVAIGLMIGLQLISGIIIGILTLVVFGSEVETATTSLLSLMMMLFGTGITTLGIICYCRKIEKRSYLSMGFKKEKVTQNYLLGFAVGLLLILAVFVLNLLSGSITSELNTAGINWLTMFIILIGFMIQGMSEEVMLRSFFMTSLASQTNVLIGILANSVFFSLLHLANPGISFLALINLILFGLVMSLIFYLTNNIWLISGIHTIWNFIQGPILGAEVSGLDFKETLLKTEINPKMSLFNGGSFGFEGGLITSFILILTIFVTIYLIKKRDLGGGK